MRLVENPAGVKEPNQDPSYERFSLLANHRCWHPKCTQTTQ